MRFTGAGCPWSNTPKMRGAAQAETAVERVESDARWRTAAALM